MLFNFENKQVYYETYGKGKPLVILNGIMMSTKSWIPFIKSFSHNNLLILVDFFDQGHSTKMENEPHYDHDIQVRLVEALLNHLNIEKASIVGISYGGEVGLEFGCRYQNRVDRLVLFNTCAYTTKWLDDIGKAWNYAAESGNGLSYYFTSIPVIYSPLFYQSRAEWMDNREKILTPVFSDPKFCNAMIRLTNSSSNYDVRKLLPNLTVPTLIISCEEDYLTPMTDQEYLIKNIKSAHWVKIPNSGHASMYERPMIFASLALGFVNTLEDSYNI